MVGGEIFVPKLPSMNIMDLAKAICPECKTEIIGIRPGEKLHEVMIPKDDALSTVEYSDYYVIKPPAYSFIANRPLPGEYKNFPVGMEYSSDKNNQWLSLPELQKIINDL